MAQKQRFAPRLSLSRLNNGLNANCPAQLLKTEFKEHFRNVSRIMDCVGCDKCRLWGKLQVTGLGTALKLLFSHDTPTPTEAKLSRGELVSFVNVLHRLSESLAAVEKFRVLWSKKESGATKKEVKKAKEKPRESVMVDKIEREKEQDEERRKPSVVSQRSQVRRHETTKPTLFGNAPPKRSEVSSPGKIWSMLVDICRESWRACFEKLRGVALGMDRRTAAGSAASGEL